MADRQFNPAHTQAYVALAVDFMEAAKRFMDKWGVPDETKPAPKPAPKPGETADHYTMVWVGSDPGASISVRNDYRGKVFVKVEGKYYVADFQDGRAIVTEGWDS